METSFRFILQETETQYYCIICDCDISGYNNAYDHSVRSRHATSLALCGNDILPKDVNRYYCAVCKCYICGYSNVRIHVDGKKHSDLNNGYESTECDSTESESSCEDGGYYQMSSSDFVIGDDELREWECCLCDILIHGDWDRRYHLMNQDHIRNLRMDGDNIWDRGNGLYYCRLCECSIPGYKNIYEHIMGRKHGNLLLD